MLIFIISQLLTKHRCNLIIHPHYFCRLIKMSSPNLNVVISLGGFIAYMSLILWGLEAFSENWDSLATTACRVSMLLLFLVIVVFIGGSRGARPARAPP